MFDYGQAKEVCYHKVIHNKFVGDRKHHQKVCVLCVCVEGWYHTIIKHSVQSVLVLHHDCEIFMSSVARLQ